ncbi:hypothetical protein HKX48_008697 [Thoreauomyces humboldtii]|nr:hypothetical protein HKX48_008697 [Thoreauomyces humboldtii]
MFLLPDSPELRLVCAIALLVAFTSAAYARLKAKLATHPGAPRGIARRTSKETLNFSLKNQYRFPRPPRSPQPSIPSVDAEDIELAPPHASAQVTKGALTRCYAFDCKAGRCYSPSCVNGGGHLAYKAVTVEKPHEQRHPKRERKMSIFSQILAHPSGAFPTKSKISPTTVQTVLYLATLPSFRDISRLISDRILPKYHRFSAIPIESTDGSMSWQPYANISVESHIKQVEVQSDAGITDYVQSLFGREWDMKQPLWFCHMIRNLGNPKRHAVVFEIHHVIGDGVSQLMILSDLVCDENGVPLTVDEKKFKKMMAAGGGKQKTFMERLKQRAVFFAHTGRAIVKVLSLPVYGGDTDTVIKTPPSGFASKNRILIPLPPLSLALVKAIKNARGCSVNDVLLACLGGALRQYLLYRSDAALLDRPKSLKIRAMMPYSFPRPLEDLHNRWTMVSAQLPVGQDTPLARLAEVKRQMDKIKSSPEPIVSVALQELAFRLLGFEVAAHTTHDVFANHSVIVTNVAGFEKQMYLCGVAVDTIMPCVSNVVMQMSIVSYRDAVCSNFVVDGARVLQPERLAQFFVRELEALRDVSGCEGPATVEQ